MSIEKLSVYSHITTMEIWLYIQHIRQQNLPTPSYRLCMMTGQILAGVDPQEAVRYQIVVMLMIVGSTALASILVLLLVRKRCFTSAMTLVLTKHIPS